MQMEIIIKVNTLMACPKVLENICGRMVVVIREILSKEKEVDMVFGIRIKMEMSVIKGIILMTRK